MLRRVAPAASYPGFWDGGRGRRAAQGTWHHGACRLLWSPRAGTAARVGCKGVGVPDYAYPTLSPPQINLLIFMRILKVILAKLRANQKGYADYKLR